MEDTRLLRSVGRDQQMNCQSLYRSGREDREGRCSLEDSFTTEVERSSRLFGTPVGTNWDTGYRVQFRLSFRTPKWKFYVGLRFNDDLPSFFETVRHRGVPLIPTVTKSHMKVLRSSLLKITRVVFLY